MIVHGIYDSILFAAGALMESISEISLVIAGIVGLAFIVGFIFFCVKMWKFGSEKIKEHLKSDEEEMENSKQELNDVFKEVK